LTALGNEHDLANHTSAHEHLVRLSCVREGKWLSDNRFKLSCFPQVEQNDQLRGILMICGFREPAQEQGMTER
jgi:hypothetical protein